MFLRKLANKITLVFGPGVDLGPPLEQNNLHPDEIKCQGRNHNPQEHSLEKRPPPDALHCCKGNSRTN